MQTVERVLALAKLLMQKKGWNYSALAKECALSRQSVQRILTRQTKTARHELFPLSVLKAAMNNGLEAEVLEILLERDSARISTVLRAALEFPDLTPEEHTRLLEAEKVIDVSPLPAEVIKLVVLKSRS
jgi:AraC-like DNA-binding protein